MAFEERLIDKRIVQRNIKKGIVDAGEYQSMLDALPDCSDNIYRPELEEEVEVEEVENRVESIDAPPVDAAAEEASPPVPHSGVVKTHEFLTAPRVTSSAPPIDDVPGSESQQANEEPAQVESPTVKPDTPSWNFVPRGTSDSTDGLSEGVPKQEDGLGEKSSNEEQEGLTGSERSTSDDNLPPKDGY